MDQVIKKYYKFIIAVIMAFFTIVSLINARDDAATFDEIAHIPAGYSYVTQHDTRLNPEHPPLLKDLAGLSTLIFVHPKFDINNSFWTGEGLNRIWDDGQWKAGVDLLYNEGNNPDAILFWARLPIILLSILLGFFLFMWGREIAGIAGGLFVLILYAFDPNILGHNHYVTTDLGIAAFLTFAFYFFLKFIKNPNWKNVFVGGIFLGLVNLVKFSSLMAFPIFGLILIVYPLVKKISDDKKEKSFISLRTKTFFSYLGKGIVAFSISMIVVWIVYFINIYKMPQEIIAKQIGFSFPLVDQNPLSQITNKSLTYLNSSSILHPFSEYFLGVSMVFKRVAGGNGTYFLEQVSSKASPVYFPVVFLIKETIPFIFLILLSIGYSVFQLGKSIVASRQKWFKERFARFLRVSVVEYTLLGFIILYSYLSITGNLNIGLRHLFPILPLAYLLVTKKIFEFIRNSHLVTQKTFCFASIFLLAWIIMIPIINYPNYVSYFNESIGGSKNGYKYVTDSNTDWGQDLKRLKIYIDEHPEIDKIRVDYFGGGNPEYYLGNKYVQWWDSMRPIETGWYAISANSLQTSIYDTTNKTSENNYIWTQQYKPVDMIGNSILIYHVTKPPVLQ